MDQQRLYELADKWKKGVITTAEMVELTSYYQARANNEDDVELPEGFTRDQASHKARLWTSVEDRTTRPIARLRKWYKYAAAIIVLIGAASAVFVLSNRPSGTTAFRLASNSIMPGHETAVLTLADGSTIVLDSTSQGMLAQQGNSQVLKLANGEIAYNVKGLEHESSLTNTMSTPKGGKYQLVLPDGSKAWLNAASSITFPTDFNGKERRVKIRGEVYFEIARNEKKPFLVDVDGRSLIEVLGTHFNVNSYPDEEEIKTTLLEGSIKINTAVVLKPGQQAWQSSIGSKNIDIRPDIDLAQVMAWKRGYFNFDNVPMQAVMRQIARWYDVEVVYEGPAPSDRLLGELPMDASIEQVLKILQEIDVHFKIKGRKIIVTKE